MKKQGLHQKSIIILSHVITTVPAEDLEKFLLDRKVKELLFIGHPLFYKEGKPGSYFKLYKNGKLVKSVSHKNYPLSGIPAYIRDILVTIFWVIKIGGKWDLIIALDNLNTITGLILKSVGYIEKVIYYTIDFVPQRFKNNVLNNIYHFLDKQSVKLADVTWNLTERMAEGREKVRGLSREVYNKQIIAPIGIWIDRIPKRKSKQTSQNVLVYAGGLSPHQGVQVVLEAIPLVVKKLPNFVFKIVGSGNYEEVLKKKSKQLKIEKYVEFLGYQEKHEDVEKILIQGDVAVAMYSKELDIWSYYADPSKIKSYLGCGLPVITTNVTYMGDELEKRRCGVVVKYDKKVLADTIIKLMKDKTQTQLYRKNALRYAKEFDWSAIYSRALKPIFSV